MGFGKKPPKPPPPPNTPQNAMYQAPTDLLNIPSFGTTSLISTSPSGLRRKANTQRVSLIGG